MELSERAFDKDTVIFRQGEPGDTMYIVQTGAVEVSREHDGTETVMARLETGDFLGEMALLDDRPRSATAKTASESRLLAITRDSLLDRVAEDPDIALYILRCLCKRLDETNISIRAGSIGQGPDTGPTEALPALEMAFPDSEYAWFEPKEKVFSQGESGDTVEISQEQGGAGNILARLGPGDVFGEMSLITEEQRNASAVCTEQTCLVSIGKDDFLAAITQRPALALYLLQKIILKLRMSLSR
jgi:CRP-like cAMP-binding protein